MHMFIKKIQMFGQFKTTTKDFFSIQIGIPIEGENNSDIN